MYIMVQQNITLYIFKYLNQKKTILVISYMKSWRKFQNFPISPSNVAIVPWEIQQ